MKKNCILNHKWKHISRSAEECLIYYEQYDVIVIVKYLHYHNVCGTITHSMILIVHIRDGSGVVSISLTVVVLLAMGLVVALNVDMLRTRYV